MRLTTRWVLMMYSTLMIPRTQNRTVGRVGRVPGTFRWFFY